MSFEVFLDCYLLGSPAGLSRDTLREIFGPHINMDSESWWYLQYDDDQSACELIVSPLTGDNNLIHSFCVYRPPADERLWEQVFRIMKLGHIILYYPGDGAPMITDEAVAENIPTAVIEALGRPICVHSGGEILQWIKS